MRYRTRVKWSQFGAVTASKWAGFVSTDVEVEPLLSVSKHNIIIAQVPGLSIYTILYKIEWHITCQFGAG